MSRAVFQLFPRSALPIVRLGGKIRAAQAAAGQATDCSGGRELLLAFLAGTHVIYYQSKLNQVIAANSVPARQPITLTAGPEPA